MAQITVPKTAEEHRAAKQETQRRRLHRGGKRGGAAVADPLFEGIKADRQAARAKRVSHREQSRRAQELLGGGALKEGTVAYLVAWRLAGAFPHVRPEEGQRRTAAAEAWVRSHLSEAERARPGAVDLGVRVGRKALRDAFDAILAEWA